MTEPIKRPRGRPPKNKDTSSQVKVDSTVASPEVKSESISHIDASQWINILSGLGTSRDKTVYTTFGSARILDPVELTQLYLAEGLAYRIVRALPEDATREWISITDKSHEDIIMDDMLRLQVEDMFTEAGSSARLQGGSIIIMGIMDGRKMDQPVNESAIRDIAYLRVVDSSCIDISASVFDENMESPTFGKLLKYKVRQTLNNKTYDTMIHYSRVLEFKSPPVPSQIYSGVTQNMKYWGMPVLQSVYNTLSAHGSILQNVSNILYEFNSGTYKLINLGQLLAAGNESLLYKRMQAIQAGTSTLNARILDKDEVYQKDYTSLASLDQLIGVYMLELCAVANMPMVRLFGKSPSGFSSGEYDVKNYYDSVEVYQRNRVAPALRYLLKILALKHKIKGRIGFEFNSLYQLNETEKVEIKKIEAEALFYEAQAYEKYMENGVRDPAAVAKEKGWEDEYVDIEPTNVTDPPPST